MQRPFGIPPRRKEIWRFGRNESPERKAIKRTGSKDYFYSHPSADGRSMLDDEITAIEQQISSILNALRSESSGNSIEPVMAASVVAHLATRTAHIRDTMEQALVEIYASVRPLLTEADTVKAYAGLDRSIPNDRFREQILHVLMEQPEITESNLPPHVLERAAFLLAKENFADIFEENLPLIHSAMEALLLDSNRLVYDSHNKALSETLKNNPREDFLKTLDWKIECGPKFSAVLPDCISIAIENDGVSKPITLSGQDDIQAIILPISPDKLLIGRKSTYVFPADFDYNVEAACASYNFFLSPYNDKETTRLHPLIGVRTISVLKQGCEEGIQSAFPEFPSTCEPDYSDEDIKFVRPTTTQFRYELSFVEFESHGEIEKITNGVKDIVFELSRILPLERLDGITIASNYAATLKDIDRGIEGASPVETVAPEIGIGIAQTVTILRSNEVKARLVISSYVAQQLISDDRALLEWAIHIFVHELALVAVIEFIEDTLPNFLHSHIDDELDSWLYANVDAALHGYIASRIAAHFGNPQEIANLKREVLAQSIGRMMSTVLQERLDYRQHGDLDKLLAVAFSSVRQVLISSADLLGHCSFMGVPPFSDSDNLYESLDQAGIAKWLNVYQADLERFYNRLGRWESIDEFLAFNFHVERLLWQLGMVPWKAPDGIRVEVPLNTDAEALLSQSEASTRMPMGGKG